MRWHIGQRVYATVKIREDDVLDEGTNLGMPTMQSEHAEKGDVGTVEFVDEDGYAMVRFDRTGSATIVSNEEIAEVA